MTTAKVDIRKNIYFERGTILAAYFLLILFLGPVEDLKAVTSCC